MNQYEKYKDSGIPWIGEIPAHWEIRRLKYVALVYPSNVDKKSREGEKTVKLCNYTDVCHNQYIHSNLAYLKATASDSQIGKFQLQKGDVIAVKDSVNTAVSALVTEDLEEVICGYHLILIRPDRSVLLGEYLFRLMDAKEISAFFEANARGVTILGLGKSVFLDLPILLPPLAEQKKIVAYLDQKTSQIDQIVQAKKRLCELLEEEREAIISQAVSKGLNPEVARKDSGIKWIGEIPAHWEIRKIKRTTYVKGRIGWKGLQSKEFSYSDAAYCVTGTDFKNREINWDGCYQISKERYDEDPYIQLKEGDLLITKDGTIGKTMIIKTLPKPATLNSGIFVTRSLAGAYNTDYMYWILNSRVFKEFVVYTRRRTTIAHLYQNIFMEFTYPLPPRAEQEEISRYLDRKTRAIDAQLVAIKKQLELFKEYRITLISKVVTGEIKIN